MSKKKQDGFRDFMSSSPSKAEHKNFSSQGGDVRNFRNGRIELMDIAGKVVGRATFKPGWKWSKNVKPIARTDWCEVPHFFYQISGRMRVNMEDGTEFEIRPGDVVFIPARHDGWVVGREDVIQIDWFPSSEYARPIRK